MKKKNQKQHSVMRYVFTLLACLFAVMQLSARQITGVVKDVNGEPVMSAQVQVLGTDIGTITDFDGNYTLNVPDGSNTLRVVPISGEPIEVAITGSRVDVNFTKKSATDLDEVVVIGYQEVKKRDLVATVSSVSGSALKDIPVSSAAAAMEGKMAGVSVTTSEGSPDATIKVRVRAGSSITQNNDPLYIVDGFPTDNINDIPVSSIQSIDVLKDASATAIYGSKGANGVIIVTTKDGSSSQGDKFKFSVDYTGFYGWKTVAKRPDVLSPRDYALVNYEGAYMNDRTKIGDNWSKYFDGHYSKTKATTGTGETRDDVDGVPLTKHLLDSIGSLSAHDWFDEAFGRTGVNSNQSITVTGGNKAANFNLSYNRVDDKAIMQASNYIKDYISLKTNFQPFKWLKFGVTGRYTDAETLGSGSNSSTNSDGSKTQSRLGNSVVYAPIDLFAKDVDNPDPELEQTGSFYDPLVTIRDNYKLKQETKENIQGYIQLKFGKHLTLKSDVGYENKETSTDRFYGKTTYYSRNAGARTDWSNGESSARVTEVHQTKLTNYNTLAYDNLFGKHHLNVLLGHEIQMLKKKDYNIYGYGYAPYYTPENGGYDVSDLFNNIYDAREIIETRWTHGNDNMLSFFGRLNYDYQGRYYVTATFRTDGSSRFGYENGKFGDEYRWGYFPSVSLGWRVSEEPILQSLRRSLDLSNLKLRFSYGIAGNANVDIGTNYLSWGKAGASNVYLNPDHFINEYLTNGSVAPNPYLTWEKNITRNLGIDIGFFNERLSATIDVYLNSTKDLLLEYPLTTGYSYMNRNIGATENKGIEASLKGIVLDKRSGNLNYGLELNVNISHNKNKITDLGGIEPPYPAATHAFDTYQVSPGTDYWVETGSPLGQIYGFKVDGWFTPDDFTGYNSTGNSGGTWTPKSTTIKYAGDLASLKPAPGVIKLKDLDEDGTVDPEHDRTVIGNTMPLFAGGFALSGTIGSPKVGTFDFNANFTYSYGNDVLNLNKVDYTTYMYNQKNRNLSSEMAWGKRYSLFTVDGEYIPGKYSPSSGGEVTGEAYNQMIEYINDVNANASIWSPINGTMQRKIVSDYAVEDGSFLRLSALTVGYSLPDNLIRKLHLTKARVFFTASNLFIITNYTGFDPEVDTRTDTPLTPNVDYSAYPKSRAYNIGLNLSF